MQLDEAKQRISIMEMARWKAGVLALRPVNKPRLFVLADMRKNAVVRSINGPIPRDNAFQAKVTKGKPEWCFFADDEPSDNWEHRYRYLILYSDGAVETVPMQAPPDVGANAPIEELSPFPV